MAPCGDRIAWSRIGGDRPQWRVVIALGELVEAHLHELFTMPQVPSGGRGTGTGASVF